MNKITIVQQAKTANLLSPVSGLLQRKCDCGSHTSTGGECKECAAKKGMLQRKLTIGASNDLLEQEADRVADQVMSTPLSSTINRTPPKIQRFTGQTSDGLNTAPPSVERVLASPGRPLEPMLRQDMEQRFGYDFSRVRVHTSSAAEKSVRDVNANAYTVGRDVVFGQGRYSPDTREGKRLLAHELVHVVQQRYSVANPPLSANYEHEADAVADAAVRGSALVNIIHSSGVGIARNAPDDKPTSIGPIVTPEIKQRLMEELQRVRLEEHFEKTTKSGEMRIIPGRSGTIGQHKNRTVAVAAIIASEGKVTYASAHFDEGMTEHAEPQLLKKVAPMVKQGDTVAVAIDQIPCGPDKAHCSGVIKEFREDQQHGSLRIFTVRSLRRDAPQTMTSQTALPENLTSPKTAMTREAEERFLFEETEFRRIRLPIYREPKGIPVATQAAATTKNTNAGILPPSVPQAPASSGNASTGAKRQRFLTPVGAFSRPGNFADDANDRAQAKGGAAILAVQGVQAVLNYFADKQQRARADAAWAETYPHIQEEIARTGRGVVVYIEYTQYTGSPVMIFEGIHWSSGGIDSGGRPGSLRAPGQTVSFTRIYVGPTVEQAAVTDETALIFRRDEARTQQRELQSLAELLAEEGWLGRKLRERAGDSIDLIRAYDAKAHIVSASLSIKDKRYSDATASLDKADTAMDEMWKQIKTYVGEKKLKELSGE